LSSIDVISSSVEHCTGIARRVSTVVTAGVQVRPPPGTAAGAAGAAGAGAGAGSAAPAPATAAKVACVSGVASTVSSLTFGSAAAAFWNASLAPAWLFLPLPRTMPMYIHALAMVCGEHLSPQAFRVPSSTPSAFSKSVAT
jgi:hypothetical protein